MLQQCTIKAPNGALGLNLSRAPWDPYPWVSGVQDESNAQLGGVCIGDTLLQLNGKDVLGMRISELATRLSEHWLTGAEHVTMMMWRQQPSGSISTGDSMESTHVVHHGLNQQSLQKFATCLQHIAQLLECPVCCDVIKPPGWQCCNGHVLCSNCRNRSEKCPVCRVPLGPRGRCLLSDKLFTLLAENFPCDGLKQGKNTGVAAECNNNHISANKCTNEYHSQPKMALPKSNSEKKSRKTDRQVLADTEPSVVNNAREEVRKQVMGMPKGNEESVQVRNNVNDANLQRCVIKEQKKENVLKELLQDGNNMLVKPKLKLSKKSWQITGQDQDELHSNEVGNINNGQQHLLGPGQVLKPSKGHQKYQNYHCPTGKSCNNQAKLFQPTSANKMSTAKQATTAESQKELDTVAEIALAAAKNSAATLSTGTHKGKPEAEALAKFLNRPSIKTPVHTHPDASKWLLLQHLSAEHNLAAVHIYGTFGQRLHVQIQMMPQEKHVCLSLSETTSPDAGSIQVHTFFLAVVAIGTVRNDSYAVFLWHLNPDQEVQQKYQTVIESQCRQVKWFGTAQPLARSWSEISAAGEFLTWTVKKQSSCTRFDITVKRK
ncbi:uncharacterized protein [Drosophila virilis]|uniref:Uncharacterized protein n=1 Tax=Drosophila virilis TaxID=7244 RepID=B4MB55_DROVI|nr:uncharacterized protein LOC6635096 [Drosophila virilis]EDW58326.2 uncharacterized protein Dvir_GJ14368 [Drosophila virilis]